MLLLATVCARPYADAWANEDAPTIDRYTDLQRLALHAQSTELGKAIAVAVWDLDDHYRTALAQTPGSRSALGPIEPADGACTLRFAMAHAPRDADAARVPDESANRAPANGSLRFRVELRDEGGDRAVFEEYLEPRTGSQLRWSERVVPLPNVPGSPFSLVLALDGHSGETGGWAAPHVVCPIQRSEPKRPPRPHVFLISIDTLRRDRLGVYGYARGTSPTLDAFASESLVFDQAFAVAPWTLPSHASIFTGRYPDEHGAGHRAPLDPLPEAPATLAESLRDAGYLTVAFTAGGIMSKANGLARGFQWWTQRTRANLSSMLPGVFDAIGILDTTLRPIFFVLHTYDVHGPYGYLPNIERHRTALERPLRPRLPARTFGTEPKTEATAKMEWERIRRIGYHAYQRLERFGSLTDVDDAYDAGVRFVDAQLAVFFQRLRELGVYDDALIIVTSDHGESLYERGLYLGHSYTLYNEELAIPLLVKLPGSKQRGRRNELVDHTDLMPLVLEVADIGVPKDLAGSNPLSRPTGARAYVRGEASHTGASFVLGRRWKWIGEAFAKVDPRSALPEALWDRFQRERTLFDLSVGERETRVNTLVPPVEEVRGLERVLDSLARPGTGKLDASGLSSEEKRQLKELGYLQ